MLKSLINIASQYKLYLIVFTLITSHGAVIKFTAAYKDGQYSRQQNKIMRQLDEANARIEKAVQEQEKLRVRLKEERTRKGLIIEKEVIKYVQVAHSTNRVIQCFDNDGLRIIRSLANGELENPGKPPGKEG